MVITRNFQNTYYIYQQTIRFVFQYKRRKKFEQKHHIIYHVKCQKDDCRDDYIDEMKTGAAGRIKNQGKDT